MAEYIDREAFVTQKRELYCKYCDRRKGMKNGKYRILYDIGDVPCRACGIEDVLSEVEDFPSADVQPVKYGRWSGYFCSNCGISKYNFISFNIVGEKEYARPFGTWNYCPRCGAKMDGEDNG